MSSNDSRYAKRKLDFHDKPFHCKSFYVDIKAETARRKITRRIKELGGNVEGFLSKDIDLFITDKKNGELEGTSKDGTASVKIANNLSRGRALLMKANAAANNRKNSTNGNDIVQNAINLGVKVQQANAFLKDSNKYTSGQKKIKRKSDDIDGISPLEWTENEKENKIFIKVEDTEQLYKPLIKYFDVFPDLFYNDDVGSPFVKGVVLTKNTDKNVNRYSTAKKTVTTTTKGGYCEACDYWYRCSLREHIKSAKHEKFVKDQTNFAKLDTVITKLPSMSDFLLKLGDLSGKELLPDKKIEDGQIEIDTEIVQHQLNNNLSLGLEMSSLNKELSEKCVERANYEQNRRTSSNEMPVLDKECSANHVSVIDGIQKEYLLQQTHENSDSEMPSLTECPDFQNSEMRENHHATFPLDKLLPEIKDISESCDSQDSGTGHDLPDCPINLSHTHNSKVSSLDGIKRTNSDSALPPDDDLSVCGNEQVCLIAQDDNAVFMEDDIYQQSSGASQSATSNIREKFSRISLSEIRNLDTSENKSEESTSNSKKLFFRHEFSSPNSKSQSQFNFKDLASHWINDICKTKENTLCHSNKETDEPDYSGSTEELKPEEFQQYKVTISSSKFNDNVVCETKTDDMKETENYSDSTESLRSEDWKFLSQNKFKNSTGNKKEGFSQISSISNSNFCENSNSMGSLSLISMPETPQNKKFCEDSSSLQSFPCTPDNTLCQSYNYEGSCSEMISESTVQSFNSGYVNFENMFNSNSKQEPIKIKINLSDIKKKEKKKKRKVKVKRKIFPDDVKENDQPYYQTQQKGEMKIKLCKVAKTPTQKNGDLMTYWKVRKSGGCRLVFSSEKRKASDQDHQDSNKTAKRRKVIL